MEKNCNIIADLLPLYVDGICSNESKVLIEEHIKTCKSCEKLLKDMQNDGIDKMLGVEPELPDSEKVLEEITLSISKKTITAASTILVIILYWLVYVWQERLATLGDYRYFSYWMHEVYGIGYIVFPFLTLAWLIRHMWKMTKNKMWKKGIALFLALLVLTTGQFCFLYKNSQKSTVTCIATVKEVVDDYHVIIEFGEREILLTTDPIVVSLLETDGTVYMFGYETYQNNKDEGYLFAVWESGIKPWE